MSMRAFMELHLTAFIAGGVLSILGVLSQHLLIRYGFVRGGPLSGVVAVVIVVALWQFFFPSASWCVVTAVIVLAMTLGANRADLWTTMNRGRWWWTEPEADHLD